MAKTPHHLYPPPALCYSFFPKTHDGSKKKKKRFNISPFQTKFRVALAKFRHATPQNARSMGSLYKVPRRQLRKGQHGLDGDEYSVENPH
jgi:hypothetical protein